MVGRDGSLMRFWMHARVLQTHDLTILQYLHKCPWCVPSSDWAHALPAAHSQYDLPALWLIQFCSLPWHSSSFACMAAALASSAFLLLSAAFSVSFFLVNSCPCKSRRAWDPQPFSITDLSHLGLCKVGAGSKYDGSCGVAL